MPFTISVIQQRDFYALSYRTRLFIVRLLCIVCTDRNFLDLIMQGVLACPVREVRGYYKLNEKIYENMNVDRQRKCD